MVSSTKRIWIGGMGPWSYDPTATYADNGDPLAGLRSEDQILIETAPTLPNHVARLQDLSNLLQTTVVAVTDIEDPSTELASIAYADAGNLVLAVEYGDSDSDADVNNEDLVTLYVADTSNSEITPDPPYTVAGADCVWVALMGAFNYTGFVTKGGIAIDGGAGVTLTGDKIYRGAVKCMTLSDTAVTFEGDIIVKGGDILDSAGNHLINVDSGAITIGGNIDCPFEIVVTDLTIGQNGYINFYDDGGVKHSQVILFGSSVYPNTIFSSHPVRIATVNGVALSMGLFECGFDTDHLDVDGNITMNAGNLYVDGGYIRVDDFKIKGSGTDILFVNTADESKGLKIDANGTVFTTGYMTCLSKFTISDGSDEADFTFASNLVTLAGDASDGIKVPKIWTNYICNSEGDVIMQMTNSATSPVLVNNDLLVTGNLRISGTKMTDEADNSIMEFDPDNQDVTFPNDLTLGGNTIRNSAGTDIIEFVNDRIYLNGEVAITSNIYTFPINLQFSREGTFDASASYGYLYYGNALCDSGRGYVATHASYITGMSVLYDVTGSAGGASWMRAYVLVNGVKVTSVTIDGTPTNAYKALDITTAAKKVATLNMYRADTVTIAVGDIVTVVFVTDQGTVSCDQVFVSLELTQARVDV